MQKKDKVIIINDKNSDIVYWKSKLKTFLKNIDIIKESLEKQIQYFPTQKLTYYHQYKSGKDYISYRSRDFETGKSICITKDKKQCVLLAMKEYCNELYKRLDQCYEGLCIAAMSVESISSAMVLKDLPCEISRLILDQFDSANDSTNIKHSKQEGDIIYSQNLKHRTSTGEMVRSKSEIIIYEKLLQHGLDFEYEPEEHIGDMLFHPDFVIRRADSKRMYWEHCGLMNNTDYVRRLKQRLEIFEQAGIVLWDNLILTFDDEFGNIDVNIIESEIANKLL